MKVAWSGLVGTQALCRTVQEIHFGLLCHIQALGPDCTALTPKAVILNCIQPLDKRSHVSLWNAEVNTCYVEERSKKC